MSRTAFCPCSQHGVFRVLMKAASERDIEQVARTVLATSWVVMGQIWLGYEVRGLENLPPEGTGALLVYYHGALPVDYYFFLAYLIVHRPDRIPHSGRLKYSLHWVLRPASVTGFEVIKANGGR